MNLIDKLKNCPIGMELDCTMYDNVRFNGVTLPAQYPIEILIPGSVIDSTLKLTEEGKFNFHSNAKCVIFPKGKTSWDDFHKPFNDGDILANDDTVFIYNGIEELSPFPSYYVYVIAEKNGHFAINTTTAKKYGTRFATEEEKNILFEAIKNNGYKWHPDTKTLTKLPMFKDGDVITCNNSACTFISIFKDKPFEKTFRQHCSIISDNNKLIVDNNKLIVGNKYADYANPRFATEEEKQKLFDAIKEKGYRWNTESKTLEKLVEPKFKIEKGKWYVCIKDLLDNYANKAFCKGDIYLSTQDGSLIPSNSNVPFEVFCPTTYFIPWTIQDAKDGDIITMGNEWGVHIFIYNNTTDKYNDHGYYAILTSRGKLKFNGFCNGKTYKLANEEEKKKLFQVIKDNGYKWNPETRSLEKLPKFKPFDKVLVRCSTLEKWRIQFFEKYDKTCKHPFICMGYNKYKQCIPYEGNEHLLDTTNDCDEYFKNL